jgi:hypothetical protein
MIEGTVHFESASVWELPEQWQPTLDNLLKHVKKFGLDNRHEKSYRGRPIRYKNYKALSNDAAVMTARAYLGEESYVFFIEGVGYPEFREEARSHWAEVRGEPTE